MGGRAGKQECPGKGGEGGVAEGRGGVGKVEALLASSMLRLVKEGIPAEFLVWDPAGCLVLGLRPFLLEGKGGLFRPSVWQTAGFPGRGEWVEGGQEPQPEQTAVHPTV